QEEPLRTGEAVDDGRLLAAERGHVGLPRDAEPAEVADVLADRERAVDGVAGCRDGLERVVLRDERAGPLLERRAVLVGPPVDEATLAVVLRALVVEAVADLVADDGADR